MLRLVLTAVFGLSISLSYGQLKKFYSLKTSAQYDTVHFSLEATSGNSYVKSASGEESPVTIYGNPDLEVVNPNFNYSIANNTCKVFLGLKHFKSADIGDGIVLAMLRTNSTDNNYWKVLLDREKIYRLNLQYGFGNTDVDLSGLPVQNFKIRSGSANIMVDYVDLQPNQIQMDSFLVKADMGSIEVRQLQLARARHIRANIGFGNAILNFNEAPLEASTVQATVGAGNLEVLIPRSGTPMIIYITDSPFCGLQLAQGFEQVERNVYVNMSYQADAPNLMKVYVDVALGNVAFRYID